MVGFVDSDHGSDASAQTGWEQWTDLDGTLHVRVVLTAADLRRIGPRTWEMLQDASRLISAALREPD